MTRLHLNGDGEVMWGEEREVGGEEDLSLCLHLWVMFRRGAEEDLEDRPTRRKLLPTTLLLQVHQESEKQLLLPIPRTLTAMLAIFVNLISVTQSRRTEQRHTVQVVDRKCTVDAWRKNSVESATSSYLFCLIWFDFETFLLIRLGSNSNRSLSFSQFGVL